DSSHSPGPLAQLLLYCINMAPPTKSPLFPYTTLFRSVLCVHGLTRNSRDFDELAEHLAVRGCRVVCMDVVGRGDSDWLEHKEDYGFAQYLSDAAALLARVTAPPHKISLLRRLQGASVGQRIDWIGTSMGGLIG